MDERTLRILTLAQLPGFGSHRIASLVRADAVDELIDHARRFESLLGPGLIPLENGTARNQARRISETALRAGQSLAVLGSPGYPSSLAALYDPPPVLFLRGSIEAPARRVAIVGARGATPWGRSMARDLARGLAERGIEVVSGLARGIDASAHEGALGGGGTTLAVLGSGVDVIYPAEHADLARRIEGRGAVISELPPGTRPMPSHFPSRNRIIVGLCEAVLVVEAGSRSGALITARVALEEGRDVLAVPGRPADPLAFGPNLLLRDGAVLIRGVEDALEHLGLDGPPSTNLSSPPDRILEGLQASDVKSVDQLAAETRLAPSVLLARLSELELAGAVERLPGTLYRRASQA